ncbi:MAG: O-succinylhomoserine sulfhydrylase [Saprospiraceae bacterium]
MKKFETKAIRTQAERSQHREHSVPLYMTSSFVFNDAEQMRAVFAKEEDGNIYSRYSNPSVDEFIEKMCLLEGAEAGYATATGMSAVFTSIAAFVSQGDHILASRAVFGSTHQLLTQLFPRWGITFTYVEPTEIDTWEQHIQPNTKMIVMETPSNPGLTLIDLKRAGEIAKKYDLILNVDNCFATPYLQNPLELGASIVTHSATKFIDGQGRSLGGIILGKAELIEQVQFLIRHTGPAMSPFNAWLLSKSLETLAVRMDRHCSNALALATFLESHEAIEHVFYPHLPSHPQYELAKSQMRQGGGIVTFEVKGGLAKAAQFIDGIKMLSLSSNLGDSRSIVTHPANTTHSKLTEAERQAVGITPGLIRISVGLEHIDDIIGDVRQALDSIE